MENPEHCWQCAYLLTGLEHVERCPECGLRLDAMCQPQLIGSWLCRQQSHVLAVLGASYILLVCAIGIDALSGYSNRTIIAFAPLVRILRCGVPGGLLLASTTLRDLPSWCKSRGFRLAVLGCLALEVVLLLFGTLGPLASWPRPLWVWMHRIDGTALIIEAALIGYASARAVWRVIRTDDLGDLPRIMGCIVGLGTSLFWPLFALGWFFYRYFVSWVPLNALWVEGCFPVFKAGHRLYEQLSWGYVVAVLTAVCWVLTWVWFRVALNRHLRRFMPS